MTLREIIAEESKLGYTSSEPTLVNKETGTFQWDITPTPLSAAVGSLDDALVQLEKAIKENPEDLKLGKYEEAFFKLKKSLKSHITRNYSE
jgi:hypothetical protein|tara:strand:+ start:935 stop:1207 length:273 start_codon:yes stop_codon:yes gene_type:complete